MARTASLLLPREMQPKEMLLADNFDPAQKLDPTKSRLLTGKGVLIQATSLVSALPEARNLFEGVQDLHDELADIVSILAVAIIDGKSAKESRTVKKLKAAIMAAEIDDEGTKLADVHPKREEATELELVELLGKLRQAEVEQCEKTLLKVRSQYVVLQAKVDVASASLANAFVQIRSAQGEFAKARKKTTRELEEELGGEFDHAAKMIDNASASAEKMLTDLSLSEPNFERFDDAMQRGLITAASVTKTRAPRRTLRINVSKPAGEMHEDWISNMQSVVNTETGRAIEEAALWNEPGFGVKPPRTLWGSPQAMSALRDLQHGAERRAADRSAREWMTEVPVDVAQMLHSIIRGLEVFRDELTWRSSFAKDQKVGRALDKAVASAMGIEYQAAWEYFNQKKLPSRTRVPNLYTPEDRRQLLRDKTWFTVVAFQAAYLAEFRQRAQEVYSSA